MADTRTTHLNLIKQDPNAVPDYLDDHSNLETLDEEVWKRGKAFNGQPVGEDGGFHIRNVPYAENLETSASQGSNESYIIRTSGGEASINDGDAWLTLLKGDRTHTGYVAQDIQMTVIPMERTPDPDITATLDEETFEAYVEQAGTYTVSYDGTSWDTSPTLYGLTISNTPIAGDSITIVWDGEEDATVTVNAATRPTPESISATINEETFVAYVSQSGTTTLTYSTAWSADPALYGITVTGTPIAGDVITVVYVKEVRGTITQSTPETFVSTGWNLYNHALGYARLIKYHEEYGFKVSGTYTALEFATTITGTRTTITPVSGYFTIPSDGYLFVTGGNNTSTQVWMTWSDWGTSANGGVFAAYTQSVIDISAFMAENFPYGLLRCGSIRDEINLNVGVATSYVVRQAYNATNLANAKASGREYEYDENYIYLERETPVTYSISVDGDYTASDHGMEYFTGTDQAVYAETIYGANLKNKLERDVVTISQQTLTSAEQAQVRSNIGAANVSDSVYYGTSSTAAGTQTKVVTISNFPSALAAGQKVLIKFANAQTYNGQPTLQINSLTAKPICKLGTTAAARYEWQAGQVIGFVYDGTNWVMVDGELANGSYPGKVKLSDAYTSSGGAASAGVGASSKAVYDAYTALNSKIMSGTLPNNTDLNTVDTVGEYFLSGSNTYTNTPDRGNFLKVSRAAETSSTVLQTVYSIEGNVFTRFRKSSSSTDWSDWKCSSLTYTDYANKTTFTIPAINRNSVRYWFGLMYLSTTPTGISVYGIFIDTDGTVTVTKLMGISSRTFTGTYSNGNITLTANETVYGGIRVIMPN